MPQNDPAAYLRNNPYMGRSFTGPPGFDPTKMGMQMPPSRVGSVGPDGGVLRGGGMSLPPPSVEGMERTTGLVTTPRGMQMPPPSGWARNFQTQRAKMPQAPGGGSGYQQFRSLIGPMRESFAARIPQSSRAGSFANTFRQARQPQAKAQPSGPANPQ